MQIRVKDLNQKGRALFKELFEQNQVKGMNILKAYEEALEEINKCYQESDLVNTSYSSFFKDEKCKKRSKH
jgi:hypothetical protein